MARSRSPNRFTVVNVPVMRAIE